MELEQLKQQWDILHAKLDEQQIINKRLMENAVRLKIDFISTYNWIGIAIGVAAIPIIILINQSHRVEDWVLATIICMLAFFNVFAIYKALQFNKTKSPKNDIINTEKMILQHQKISFWYYILTLIIVFGFLILSTFIFYERLVAYNRLWFFAVIIIGGIFAGIREMKWYLGKVNDLHQSISDLKEFEKEE